ncbi:MAG: hypothetical protein WCJ30_19665 [Deltaproteobacteria bacterium]
MSHRLLRASLALALSLGLSACASNGGITVAVIAPDGGDPFLGDDAATRARIILENDASTTVVADVGVGGAFQIDIRPQDSEYSRLRVEALRGNDIIATGSTPPAYWSALQRHVIPVLMQYRDSVTPGPGVWAGGHADFELLEITPRYIGIFTAVAGSETPFHPEVYDLLLHARVAPGEAPQLLDGQFDGDSTVAIVALSGGSAFPYVFRGAVFTSWAGDGSVDAGAPIYPIPSSRTGAGITRSTAVRDVSTGGGWLVGGRDASGPVRRVDRIDSPFAVTEATPLLVARVRPQIIQIFAATTGSPQPVWLVAGGNLAGTPFLETYSPDGRTNHTLDLLDHERSDASVVCIAVDGQGCTRMLVVGGRVGTALAPDSLALDATAIRQSTTPIVSATGPGLVHPRSGARAAFAEGGAVVIAGGDDDAGPVTVVEMIDVTAVTGTQPPPVGRVVDSTTTCAHPAILAVSNGSVMITGGTHSDGSACTGISFFRH